MTVTSPLDKEAGVGGPYRVMVVDDSAIIRGFLSRYLSEDPLVDVVTTANNGSVALGQLERHDIEVVVLDIEMPVMDGMTALPKMLEAKPDLQIVMASTLTRKNAEVSLRALRMGAVDYVPKPETARSVNASIDFRRELVEKVKVWASRRRKRKGEPDPELETPENTAPSGRLSAGFITAKRPEIAVTSSHRRPIVAVSSARESGQDNETARTKEKTVQLRPDSRKPVDVLAVGSSTGGPQALMKFFAAFKEVPNVPILITQHMPPAFTAILAEHIHQATKWPACEASNGQELKAGHIYVAPGGKHLEVAKEGTRIFTRLSDGPQENFCKPAVDPMLRSLVSVFGDRILAVILTGMGHDGLKGSRDLTKQGGTLYAQDEASSVVWGMPGAVATAGLCSQVLPLEELGQKVSERLKRNGYAS